LRNVTITVQTQIPSYAFYNCSFLTSIVLPTSVTSTGDNAYYNCSATVTNTYAPTVSSPWDGTTISTAFHSGSGTSADPYVIFDGCDWSYLTSQVNSGVSYDGIYFTLSSNIDLNGNTVPVIGDSESHQFLGHINGYGHEVSNFTITGSTQYVGLFGYFGGSLERIDFNNGAVTSAVTGNSHFYSGLVAYMASTGSISNIKSSVSVSISGGYYLYAGGIVGYMAGGSITNSWSSKAVSATSANIFAYAGNICGYVDAGTISGCYGSGSVTANGSALNYSCNGGIVGSKGTTATITDSYIYSGAVMTRYSTSGSSFNSDGTVASSSDAMAALKLLWNSTVWDMTGDWPALQC
jgi:hypothetical protein